MLSVIKLINVHYRDENHRAMKVQFKTTIEGMDEYSKYYYITVEGEEEREVTKEEGNQYYKQLRERYPQMKALTLIDVNHEAVTHIRVVEHFEVRLGYDYVCSCDDMKEVREAEERVKEALRQ